MDETKPTNILEGKGEKSIHPTRRNQITTGNCITHMKEMVDDCMDLIVADPPYNLSADVGSWEWSDKNWEITNEEWDSQKWDAYERFINEFFKEASRILKPTGTIWCFSSYHNNPYINLGIREYGEVLNEIVWFKRDAFPNMTGRRFTASHETIYWGHLNGEDRKYEWNYQTTRDMSCPEDSFTENDKQIRSMWDIPKSKTKKEGQFGDHGTQKPLRVYERILRSTANEEDDIYFPFVGSGAGCLSAKLNNMFYIGSEVDMEQAQKARDYVSAIGEKPDSVSASSGFM